jgi:hypothetical protein
MAVVPQQMEGQWESQHSKKDNKQASIMLNYEKSYKSRYDHNILISRWTIRAGFVFERANGMTCIWLGYLSSTSQMTYQKC